MYMNLTRSPVRNELFLSGMAEMETPEQIIHRVESVDGLEYTAAGIIELLGNESVIIQNEDKGVYTEHGTRFHDYKVLIKEEIPKYHPLQHSINILACKATYAKALNAIVDTGKTTLLMEDDHIINVTWLKLKELTDPIITRPYFLFCSLGSWFHEGETDLIKGEVMDGWVEGTIGLAQQGNIYTPSGARVLLEKAKHYPLQSFETVIHDSCDMSNVYSRSEEASLITNTGEKSDIWT